MVPHDAGPEHDFNAELHARPSIYFKGPAFVEHVALLFGATDGVPLRPAFEGAALAETGSRTRVEVHTEFVTVTRVTPLSCDGDDWPSTTLSSTEAARLSGLGEAKVAYRGGMVVRGPPPDDIGRLLRAFGFGDTAASRIAADAAAVCSDFKVRADGSSRIILFNSDLNAYRLGRMVRRMFEIETYRAMALLGLPEARRLGAALKLADDRLSDLAKRNVEIAPSGHPELLRDISAVSAQLISASAATRNRFGATAAYAKIVEERIGELRETHFPGFQRFGVFVTRRFRPAVRTCEATARRLDQLSATAVYLIDLLQTRIQVEIEYQNAVQIHAMAERAATQIKIQKAVEGFSIIAISYYLVALLKAAIEAADHIGFHVDPTVTLVSIPVFVVAVALATARVKRAIGSETRK